MEWPSRSPTVTPLDYYLWGHVKYVVYAVKIRDVDHLKERIVDACYNITADTLRKVLREWKMRMQLTIDRNGEHIEHAL